MPLSVYNSIVNRTEQRFEGVYRMRFIYSMQAAAYPVKAHGHFIRVERNRLDPIGGGAFVSIAYYEMPDGAVFGLVM